MQTLFTPKEAQETEPGAPKIMLRKINDTLMQLWLSLPWKLQTLLKEKWLKKKESKQWSNPDAQVQTQIAEEEKAWTWNSAKNIHRWQVSMKKKMFNVIGHKTATQTRCQHMINAIEGVKQKGNVWLMGAATFRSSFYNSLKRHNTHLSYGKTNTHFGTYPNELKIAFTESSVHKLLTILLITSKTWRQSWYISVGE